MVQLEPCLNNSTWLLENYFGTSICTTIPEELNITTCQHKNNDQRKSIRQHEAPVEDQRPTHRDQLRENEATTFSMMPTSSMSNTPLQPQRRILQRRPNKRINTKTEGETTNNDYHHQSATSPSHITVRKILSISLTQRICFDRQRFDPISHSLGGCVGGLFFSCCCLEEFGRGVDEAGWCF